MGGGGKQPPGPAAAGDVLSTLQEGLVEAYRSHVSWDFPARDELRTRAYLFTAAALYCACVACLTRVRGRANIAFMAGSIHLMASTSYFLMVG